MIDLHCHSHYSDGQCSPADLLSLAAARQLRYLALTDHDTILGYTALAAQAKSTGLQVIPGLELSVRWKKHDLHLLAYQFQVTEALGQLLEQQAQNRILRAQEIGRNLASIGLTDAYTKACALAGHARAARPHFAQVLVTEGKARTLQEAFKRYLVRGRIGYVQSAWVTLEAGVSTLLAAGGTCAIAHPLRYQLTRSKLHALMEVFKACGGQAVEVVSGWMQPAEIQEMTALSRRFSLLASTGSDFHSEKYSRIALGAQGPLPAACVPIWRNWGLEQI